MYLQFLFLTPFRYVWADVVVGRLLSCVFLTAITVHMGVRQAVKSNDCVGSFASSERAAQWREPKNDQLSVAAPSPTSSGTSVRC